MLGRALSIRQLYLLAALAAALLSGIYYLIKLRQECGPVPLLACAKQALGLGVHVDKDAPEDAEKKGANKSPKRIAEEKEHAAEEALRAAEQLRRDREEAERRAKVAEEKRIAAEALIAEERERARIAEFRRLQNSRSLSKLAGPWKVRREGQANSAPIPTANFTIEVTGEGFLVLGDVWTAQGSFDGTNGYYDWVFKDGRRGRTTIQMDASGALHGQVRGAGIEWDYVATRY